MLPQNLEKSRIYPTHHVVLKHKVGSFWFNLTLTSLQEPLNRFSATDWVCESFQSNKLPKPQSTPSTTRSSIRFFFVRHDSFVAAFGKSICQVVSRVVLLLAAFGNVCSMCVFFVCVNVRDVLFVAAFGNKCCIWVCLCPFRICLASPERFTALSKLAAIKIKLANV